MRKEVKTVQNSLDTIIDHISDLNETKVKMKTLLNATETKLLEVKINIINIMCSNY